MSESRRTVKKPSKIKCTVKRPFRFSENTPTRKKGEHRLNQDEYNFALENNCLEIGG